MAAGGRPDGKLSLVTKVVYGSGDIFGGGALVIVGFFYLFFLTEVARLSPALAGLALLLGKVWDAVSDPLMGYLSDRTRSRFGRRRVYFLAGVAPIAVVFTLLWTVPPWQSQLALFAYFLALNVAFDIVITMVMVPYSALIQELTFDYGERSALTGYRLAFSNIASLLAAVLPMLIIKQFADPADGYRNMAMLFGLFFALPWIGVFLVSFERQTRQEESQAGLVRDALATLANRSFRMLVGIYLLTYLAIDIISAVLVYYLTYAIGRPGDVSVVLGLLLILQLASLPVHVYIAQRWDKRVSFLAGAALWVLLLPWLFLVGPETPAWVVYVLAALIGVGTGGAGFSPWAMFPDVLDVEELVTGQRRQGIYAGVMTFLRKVSAAVAMFLIGAAIQFSGYAPGAAQPPPFLVTVRVLVAFLPILLVAAAMAMARRFPITAARYRVMRAELERRYQGAPGGDDQVPGVLAALYGRAPAAAAPSTGQDGVMG